MKGFLFPSYEKTVDLFNSIPLHSSRQKKSTARNNKISESMMALLH